LAGPRLGDDEAAFLRTVRPCGVILFARNVEDPGQLRRLTADIGSAIGASDILILIDQEGGRVQRLRPPHWRDLPAAALYAQAYTQNPNAGLRAAHLVARLMAQELRDVGINTDCAPVLDVPVAGSHGIIGDRAFGETPEQVAALGAAVAQGLIDGGVLPVIKHIPGHGRATKDSHLDLPVVTASLADLTRTDFASFRRLAHLPAAMTAHVVFADIDAGAPASTSKMVTSEIIRREIGFDGLLMSDDLGMHALSGPIEARAQAVLAAGSDVALLCSGSLAEAEAVAAVVPRLAGAALTRFERACAVIRQQPQPFDEMEALACLAEVCQGRPESV
jgi:beta-N-acetylhexosaminidase